MGANIPRQIDSLDNAVGLLREFTPDGRAPVLFRGQPIDRPLHPSLFRDWPATRPIAELLTREQNMLAKFKTVGAYLLPSRPSDDWGWLSVGQHYGLPTRLLDWSTNPLVALYFAVQGRHSDDAVLWAYRVKPSDLLDPAKHGSPLEIRFTKVFSPFSHSLRVSLQQSWHTAHRLFGDNHDKIWALERVAAHRDRLTRFVVKRDACDRLCGDLERMGISQETVFADLASFAANVKHRYVDW